MESVILSDTQTTFQHDKELLTLPVPDLSYTLKKYLESVKVLVSDEEYRRTEFLAQQFASGDGKYLQRKLEEKARGERNWLDKWWLDVAYLESRVPIPLVNMGGPGPYGDDIWPAQAGSQLFRASMLMHYTLKFWQFIQREQYKPMKDGKGRPLCMFQFRRIFNTCRVPGIFQDKLVNDFKPASLGDCPSHVIIFCKGHIFTLNTLDEAGEVLTPPEFEMQFKKIREQTDRMGPSDGISYLTTLPRDRWAKVRSTLVALNPKNYEIFESIQTSVIALGLDDVDATDVDDLANKSLLGDVDNRWCDKSLVIGVYKNGLAVSCADHAPAEGLMMVYVTNYIHTKIKENDGVWKGRNVIRPQPEPQLLKFEVNDIILQEVKEAKILYKELQNVGTAHIMEYKKYGKAFCKKARIHPDSLCQLALHLAYYTTYRKMAPAYETAPIKQFYRGRTETLRSCTMEAYDWCKAMVDPKCTVAERLKLFIKAVTKQGTMMAEACELKGCDRHLLGLYLIAREEERPLHALFRDPSFTKSGGGGNFILSTSCIGYTTVMGAVLPMCKDSIGVFYRINDDKLTFYITTWNADKDTDSKGFGKAVGNALDAMQELVIQGASLSGARL